MPSRGALPAAGFRFGSCLALGHPGRGSLTPTCCLFSEPSNRETGLGGTSQVRGSRITWGAGAQVRGTPSGASPPPQVLTQPLPAVIQHSHRDLLCVSTADPKAKSVVWGPFNLRGQFCTPRSSHWHQQSQGKQKVRATVGTDTNKTLVCQDLVSSLSKGTCPQLESVPGSLTPLCSVHPRFWKCFRPPFAFGKGVGLPGPGLRRWPALSLGPLTE